MTSNNSPEITYDEMCLCDAYMDVLNRIVVADAEMIILENAPQPSLAFELHLSEFLATQHKKIKEIKQLLESFGNDKGIL